MIAATALMASALIAGCQSAPPGNQQPSVKNAAPSPSATVAPSPGVPLSPQNGYVFIQTPSGQTRCQISTAEVDCEAPFATPPTIDGLPANGVRVTTSGQLAWVSGNLGDIPVVTIENRTYSAEGWTIIASDDGIRFTNDNTRHGMFVAIKKVEAF